jgi:hypothetical protein
VSSAANSAQLQLQINDDISTSGFLVVEFEDGTPGKSIPGYTFKQCK